MRETALLSQEEEEKKEEEKKEEEEDEMSSMTASDVYKKVDKERDECERFSVEELALVEVKTRGWKRALMCCQYPRTRIGLLLCRGSLFVLGAALVIGAGVSSQYHPPVSHGNYSECTDDSNISDVLTAIVSPSSSPTPSSTLTVPSGSTLFPTRTVTSQWSLGYTTTATDVRSYSSASNVLPSATPTPSSVSSVAVTSWSLCYNTTVITVESHSNVLPTPTHK